MSSGVICTVYTFYTIKEFYSMQQFCCQYWRCDVKKKRTNERRATIQQGKWRKKGKQVVCIVNVVSKRVNKSPEIVADGDAFCDGGAVLRLSIDIDSRTTAIAFKREWFHHKVLTYCWQKLGNEFSFVRVCKNAGNDNIAIFVLRTLLT